MALLGALGLQQCRKISCMKNKKWSGLSTRRSWRKSKEYSKFLRSMCARKVKDYVKFLKKVRTWRRGEADPCGCLLAGAQAMEATVLPVRQRGQ